MSDIFQLNVRRSGHFWFWSGIMSRQRFFVFWLKYFLCFLTVIVWTNFLNVWSKSETMSWHFSHPISCSATYMQACSTERAVIYKCTHHAVLYVQNMYKAILLINGWAHAHTSPSWLCHYICTSHYSIFKILTKFLSLVISLR